MKGFVFLDRDGVINRFPGVGKYVVRPEDFQLLPKVKEAIAALTKAGYEINVISNQGCVSRGMITLEDLESMTAGMLKEVEAAGGRIQGVYYCIHQTSDRCDCKKPKTKLFYQAARGRDIDFSKAYYIGDSQEDMQAGDSLGCHTVLVLSGRTQEENIGAFLVKPQTVKKDLWEAVTWLLEKKS